MLARWAAEDGWEVLVIGDEADRTLAEEVVRGALDDGLAEAARAGRREPAAAWGPDEGRRLDRVDPVSAAPGTVRSVAGQLSVRGLVGLLAGCDAMVGNDSGPRHLAQAVGTPTVGIFWIGNTVMAAPLGRAEHRIHSGWTTHCPVCGTDLTQLGWTATDCGHVVGLNDAVRPQDVYADVLDLLEARVSEGPARG
ncbi:glycosyltransferase family 9 protein [Raineyella fluvialis]|uniref:Glycosyltransferase family 9 (Heptosyltransferase) n=1 Tax=Raineyella fluvialis TaxID=2662261 RepID=A0A5Q2FCT2_9ACTN|nr:glycosyltransferase family 9 protein [Raineyella fluvialis]QGF24588.1 hypothetical protein Rai3103_14175 [Raineyella fluvialis]